MRGSTRYSYDVVAVHNNNCISSGEQVTLSMTFGTTGNKKALMRTSSSPGPAFSWNEKSFCGDDDNYRFGFNGQMKDDEVYGEGNAYSFEYRIHDPRIGRFLSVDPIGGNFPWNSSYAFAENDVLRFIDLEGLEVPSKPATVTHGAMTTTAIDVTNTGGTLLITEQMQLRMAWNRIEIAINSHHEKQMGNKFEQGGTMGREDFKQFKSNMEIYGPYTIPFYDVSKKLLAGEEISWVDIGIEMAGFVPFGKVVGKGFKAVLNSPFGDAAMRELGTFLKNNANETTSVIISRLNSSIKSHEKQILKHKEWIANPKLKYGDEWDTFSQTRKNNEIHHWKQDVSRHEAYRDAKKAAVEQIEKEGKK